jgi:MFS family permease
MALDTRHDPGAATTVAVAAMFFLNGATYGSWIPRLPEIQQQLEVSDALLGLTLVGGGIGGLLTSVLAGRLVDRVGSRRATVTTSVVLACLLPLVGFAPLPGVLFLTLLSIGALDGLTDVAQNTQAMELQALRSRSIVSRMHALWSIGTLGGGVVATRAARAGIELEHQLLATSVVLALGALVAGRHLLPPGPLEHELLHPDEAGPGAEGTSRPVRRGVRLPRHLVVLLVSLGMSAILAEMPSTEWASLVMAERFDLDAAAAGIGFVVFAAGMVVGRLGGDLVVDRFGTEPTRRAGGLLGLLGVLLVAVSPTPWVAGVGLVVSAVGVSSLFPLAIRRASELAGGSSRGVATFSAGARLGILIASPTMGLVSELTTRSTALVLIAGSAAAASAALRIPDRVRPTAA